MVFATEPFEKLLKVMLRSRQASEAIAVVLKGNPEYLEPAALAGVADRALDEAVQRLTTGRGNLDKLIE